MDSYLILFRTQINTDEHGLKKEKLIRLRREKLKEGFLSYYLWGHGFSRARPNRLARMAGAVNTDYLWAYGAAKWILNWLEANCKKFSLAVGEMITFMRVHPCPKLYY